jgi:integrase
MSASNITRRDHGDGGIDQRGPDRWRLRWRVGSQRYSKAFRGTKRAAQTELRRLLKGADDGRHVAPDRITLSAWSEQWLALLERRTDAEDDPSKRNRRRRRGLVSARTLERYCDMLRVHILPTLGTRPLQQISTTEIDDLYIKLERQLAPGTVRFIHAVLGACLAAAMRKKILLSNPASDADTPPSSEDEVGQVLDSEELADLLAGFRKFTLYPLIATAAFTGARRNELLSLLWSDVNLAEKTLTIARSLEITKAHGWRFKEPKTKRGRRTIVIDDHLVVLLSKEREKHLRLIAGVDDDASVDLSLLKLPEDALVFPSFAGANIDLARPRHPHGVSGEFSKRVRKLGFDKLRFHDLRASHETMLLDAGVPVHVVAARCGHDPAVLLRAYAKRTKKADTSAAAVIGALSKGMIG